MPASLDIPKLGMTMSSARIVKWLKLPGDAVGANEPVVEIETEKIVSDVNSPVSGILSDHLVSEGEEVSVGQTISWILVDGESKESVYSSGELAAADSTKAPTTSVHAQSSDRTQPSLRRNTPLCSPAVRRLARDLGIDLNSITGSGPKGRILKQDLNESLPQVQLNSAKRSQIVDSDTSVVVQLSAMRRAITDIVTQSATIPSIVLNTTVDASSLMRVRQLYDSVVYEDMLILATAKTLSDHEYLNASYEGDSIRLNRLVNIGLAVAVDHGLIIPVIRNAAEMTLEQVSDERNRLVDLVRTGGLSKSDLADGTFTITNLGMYPIDSFTALIHPPQAAILSVGRIRHVVELDRDVGVVFRPKLALGLTVDHRVADGATAAAFVEDLINRLEGSE